MNDLRQSRDTPAIPIEVLDQIADLVQVPPEHRALFYKLIRENVETARELDAIRHGLATKRGKNLARSALALYDTIGNLNHRERELVTNTLGKGRSIFGKLSEDGVDGLYETAYRIAVLSCLLTGKPPPRDPSQAPDPPVAGRPSGAVKDWMSRNFIRDVLISITETGGEFQSVTIVRKLTAILEPYLPDAIAPELLPRSTFRRLIDAHVRTQQALKEIDV
jgi:hypothetical protein